MEEKSEIFYVGIKSPIEVRRALLEGSRNIVEGLQRYERFKILREKKNSEILRFKEDMKAINSLVAKLRRVLPAAKLREVLPNVKKGKKVKEKEPVIKPIPKPKATPQTNELEKLEGELADIETKLSKLG